MTIVLDKAVQDLVNQAVNKLIQTVGDNVKLVRGIDSEIMNLTSDIETFNARLVDSYRNPWANELQVLKVVVKKFQAVVNEAQDVVAKYIALKKKHEDNALAKCLDNIPVPVCGNINVSASEIQFIRTMLHTIRQDHEKDLQSLMNYLNNTPPSLQAQPVVEEDYVNVFEDDLRTIKNQLIDASNNFIVIPIVGMPGIGKTTFARRIFEDPDILCNKFVHCIWVQVSQNFNRKQKFIDILDQITKHTEGFSNISEDRLEGRIKELLKDKKYFIVADDVWEKKDWNSLKHAFPENSKGSRVLVTTRHDNVADSIGKPHTLKVLSDKASWLLLKKNVFGEEGCSMLFEPQGKKIAEKCKGIPLALTVVAGILRKYRTPVDWERVAENPFLEINRNDQSYHNVVMLSYHHLPHEKLKNCFLYFACFPMGHEIAAWKLIHLWIAEGFIPTTDESKYPLDMEVEAKKYLNDLVDRNLVMVLEKSADGQIKICRIHDSLHEFCKSEAAKKNLFHVMEGEQQRLDANTISFRRLCFHSSIAKIFDAENNPSCSFFNLNKTRSPGERVHSLLFSCSQKSEIHLKQDQLATISNTFQNLRVLDIESFESESLPNELYALSLLRYLAITTKLNILPKSIEKLRELVTLIFRTTKPTIEIKGSIWNMKRLMHVHTNTSTQLPSPPKNRIKNSGIHTLCVISPASCTKEIFSKTPKLKKLGVSGNLVELLDENEEICLFNNLQMLDCLENLKLRGQSEKVLKVPRQENFPCRLRKLTLSNTLFEWNDMSILGSLEMLEVLKLDENAFIGDLWDLSNDVVFEKLQYLRIGKTNLVTWNATENSFPVLEHLVLRNCIELEGIPNAFANAHSLKVMELFHVSEKATDSATNVCKQRHDDIDLSITSLLSQSNVYEQTQVEENVNIPRTSASLQAIALGVDEFDVVGFDNEVKTIKNRLSRGSKKLKTISIVGLKGLGKTILANMLYKDNEVQYEFFTRLWIDVSRTFDAKKIFSNILSELTDKANEYDNMSEGQLADKIKELLESEKYLIVMEDVWTLQDWDCLKIAFPNNMRGSRVLVTTRQHEVAFCVDSSHNPHQLKFLNNEESWKLLEKKVFCKDKCSTLLEDLGRRMVANCKGVPHVVVSIASVLEKNKAPTEWERIANDRFAIIDYMNQEDNPLIQLFFDEMDFQLKDCFLYLAAFPIRHEIAVRKLIRLWIAEGFIPLKEGGYTSDFEHIAEKYLEDLIGMNLLMVLKRRADGQIKTCRIHDKLHQFCKAEAANKNHVHEMDGAKLEVDKNSRRLCVHSSVLDFLKSESKPSNKHVRSFLSSCTEEIDIPDEHLATIPKSFPILRVVDVESLKFKSLPEELYHLDHLRYLAVSTDLKLLPENFFHFQNMETLVLKTSQNSLEIKADIWSMPKLRHLCSNVSMQLPPNPKIRNNSLGSNIETLWTISPSSCTGEILGMTPNIQKLGIRGNLVELMENKSGISLFDNLQKLSHLKNLKLMNESTHSQAGKLGSVPQHDKFPQGLRKLTLWNTSFEWKDMCILGELNELEVLKLEEYAFMGKSWELDNIVFKQLQFLRIKSNDLAYWTTSQSCFPVLKTLELKHCHYLEAVPDVFADVDSLKLLDLYHTNEKAANSARKIEKLKRDKGNAESSGFKLSIYPPNH